MNFKVGQKWKRRDGSITTILSVDWHDDYKIMGDDGISRTVEGRQYESGAPEKYDLVDLVTDVPEKQEIAITSLVPHVHAYYIKQWADGMKVQGRCKETKGEWIDVKDVPNWWTTFEYRVKPVSVFRILMNDQWLYPTKFDSLQTCWDMQFKHVAGVLEFTGDDVFFHKKE